MSVTVYDANGKAEFIQNWNINDEHSHDGPGAKVDASMFQLNGVQVLNEDGAVKMDIQLHADGVTPQKIVVRQDASTGYPAVETVLRDDQTVEEVLTYDAGGN